ncbi:MAG: phage holin family protein [Verrucomicrobiia bacterium]|jgi:uncharacterized membrane protein YqjE
MDESKEPSDGLLSSLRRLIDTGLGLAQTRLELLSVELQREKNRLIEVLVWILIAVVLGLVALILVSFTLVVLFWDSARVVVLVLLCVLYVGGAIWAVQRARKILKQSRTPLKDSIEELKKDRACL